MNNLTKESKIALAVTAALTALLLIIALILAISGVGAALVKNVTEVDEYETVSETGNELMFSFTPSDTGDYNIIIGAKFGCSLYVLDENSEKAFENYDLDNYYYISSSKTLTRELEKGETYYFYIKTYGSNENKISFFVSD